jgi:hypothetical protein
MSSISLSFQPTYGIAKHRRLPEIDILPDTTHRDSPSTSALTQLWYKGPTPGGVPNNTDKYKQKLAFVVPEEAIRGYTEIKTLGPDRDVFEREKLRLLETQTDNIEKIVPENSSGNDSQVSLLTD